MKILLDFLPIVLFFGTFKYADRHAAWAGDFATRHFGFLVSGGVVGPKEGPVLLATLVVIAATLAQIAVGRRRLAADSRVRKLAAQLDALSPLAVLGRGYAVCWNETRTSIIRAAAAVSPGDGVRVTLADGELACQVVSAGAVRPADGTRDA